MPIKSPLTTRPTTSPRFSGAAKWAASGTREPAKKVEYEWLAATAIKAKNAAQKIESTKRRFSTRSPSGAMKIKPAA
jgi:hypothetical protein